MADIDLATVLLLVAISLFTAVFAVVLFAPANAAGLATDNPAAASYGNDTNNLPVPVFTPLPDTAALCELVDLSPILIWRQDQAGNLVWANASYRKLQNRLHPPSGQQNAPLKVLFKPLAADQTTTRQMLDLPPPANSRWFELSAQRATNGTILNFAQRADAVVQAEDALRNFTQTLTKTFAHLPIGLAIFDRNRQLALFNPSLADLTTLEPEWLTARPTLRTFLDRLREHRHVPEPKDYKSWRERIAALEKAAEDGTYEENWPLPTGQTYRVTGRPHPDGAVAFVFEDITDSIKLKRQYRSELETVQAVLDNLEQAIAVFSPSGELTIANDAFVDLWGFDPREMLARPDWSRAIDLWTDACDTDDCRQAFQAAADKPQGRTGPVVQARLKSGLKIQCRFQSLPGGATLCRFSTVQGAEPRRHLVS